MNAVVEVGINNKLAYKDASYIMEDQRRQHRSIFNEPFSFSFALVMKKIRKLALPVGVVNLLLQLFVESANLAVKSIESKNRYFFNLLIESLDLKTYHN